MLIDEIISKIDEGDGARRSYYAFETFILNLLKAHLEDQNKEIITNLGPKSPWDAIAPEGFDKLSGRTAIEIRFSSKVPVQILLSKLFQRISRLDNNEFKVENLVFIFAKPISIMVRDRLEKEIASKDFDFRVLIWGPEEINAIVNKHRKLANNIVNKLFSLRLESAVKKQKTNWKEEQEIIIERLKRLYKKGQFSLFLGAGVSSSAGIPDWNTLLNSLFVTYLTKEFDGDSIITDQDITELVERLNNIDEPSALMAARYLRKGLTKNSAEIKAFSEAITKNLYKLRSSEKPLASPLIKSITAMCMPRMTGAKVKSVVTYNFDDLIERQLVAQSIMHRSIFTENESYDPDELPVYHVHGFLPKNRSDYESLEKSTLVFSEEGYHQIYSEAYHWSNLVQLNKLRENNCLMVGLSMTDPNLRRLLDISARNIEKTKHFAFMKRITSESFCYENATALKKKKQIISSISSAKEFLDRHHSLNEELMKELGVEVIWYEDYDQIPIILEQIANL